MEASKDLICLNILFLDAHKEIGGYRAFLAIIDTPPLLDLQILLQDPRPENTYIPRAQNQEKPIKRPALALIDSVL